MKLKKILIFVFPLIERLKFMKKFLFVGLSLLFTSMMGLAESSITIGIESISGAETEISINGDGVCDLNGPVEKEISPVGPMVVGLKQLKPCYRRIIVPEGNCILSVKIDFLNPVLNEHTQYMSETSLDIEDGENYYLEVESNEILDIEIKELNKKEAEKRFKKWEELPTVTVD